MTIEEFIMKVERSEDAKEILGEMVHEIKSLEGTKINNNGSMSQISYLGASGVTLKEMAEATKLS